MTNHATFDCDQALRLLHEKDAQIAGLNARVEAMRGALEKIISAQRWSCDVTTGLLEQEQDGPWVMVDHKKIKAILTDSPQPALAPDLHKTVSANWTQELEHDNAVLRDVLAKIAEGDHVGTPINKGSAVMMMIEEALENTSAVKVVPLEEVKGLLEALEELLGEHVWAKHNWTESGHLGICSIGSGDPSQCTVCGETVRAKNALAAWRTKHP